MNLGAEVRNLQIYGTGGTGAMSDLTISPGSLTDPRLLDFTTTKAFIDKPQDYNMKDLTTLEPTED